MININDKLIRQDLSKIGAEAFAVLMAISIHANSSNTAFPGIKRQMELTGLSRNKVYRAINVLIENKYLERSQVRKDLDGKGDSFGMTVYKVTTKYLSVWMPISETIFEEKEEPDVLTHFGDAQNEDTQIGTISINKKGSINKLGSLNVVCEQTTPTPTQTKLQQRLNCKNAKHEAQVIEIVDYFNQVSGHSAQPHTKGALELILYWLNEGYTILDFKKVIDFKTRLFKEMKKPENIALDTYCRKIHFEDNLEKANAQALSTSADQSLNDIELTQEQAAQYEASKAYILDHYPNLKEVRFFSHREFLLFSTNNNREFLPEFWKNKATERNMRQMKIDAMAKLNNNTYERKAAGSLYEYVKTHIRNELKKDN